MKKKKPLITVVVATLNSEKKIKFLLNSIIDQKYKNIEVIIVDSSRDDKIRIVLKKYLKNIKIYFYKINTGLYGALNFGIKKSKGDFVNFIGSDDCYYSDNIFHIISKKEIKKPIIYYGNTIYYKNKFSTKTRYYRSGRVNKLKFSFGMMPSHTSCFFTKNAIRKVKSYNTNYKIASDFDFILRCFKKNIKFINLNNIITKMSEGGISNKSIKSIFFQNYEIANILKKNKIKSNFILILFKLFFKFISKTIYRINLKLFSYSKF